MVDCLTRPKLGRGTGLPERVNVTTPKPVESPLTKRLGRMIMGTRHHPYGLFKCHHSHARHLQQPFLNTILVYRYISIYIYIFTTATKTHSKLEKAWSTEDIFQKRATKALAECNWGFNYLHFPSVVALTNLRIFCDIFPLLNQSPSTSSFLGGSPYKKPPFYMISFYKTSKSWHGFFQPQ